MAREHLQQHREVAALEPVADVGQAQERLAGGAGGRREEVAATERVVAADADDQVRRVRRQVPELLAPAHGRAPVDGQERRSRAVRQPLPHLPDDAEGPAAT
jgi:hypothetical protein